MSIPDHPQALTQEEEANRLRAYALFTIKLLYSQISERQKQGGLENERMAREFQSLLGILCQELLVKCHLEVILPKPGDLFDARLHAALGQESRQDMAPGCIVRVVSPGFRSGNRVTFSQVTVSK